MARIFTRAQAEKQIANGADPEPFTTHVNYHVRCKAYRRMFESGRWDLSEMVEDTAQACFPNDYRKVEKAIGDLGKLLRMAMIGG